VRAGADLLITYFARDLASTLHEAARPAALAETLK